MKCSFGHDSEITQYWKMNKSETDIIQTENICPDCWKILVKELS